MSKEWSRAASAVLAATGLVPSLQMGSCERGMITKQQRELGASGSRLFGSGVPRARVFKVCGSRDSDEALGCNGFRLSWLARAPNSKLGAEAPEEVQRCLRRALAALASPDQKTQIAGTNLPGCLPCPGGSKDRALRRGQPRRFSNQKPALCRCAKKPC